MHVRDALVVRHKQGVLCSKWRCCKWHSGRSSDCGCACPVCLRAGGAAVARARSRCALLEVVLRKEHWGGAHSYMGGRSVRLPPATWWFRRKVLALPVWWQRQHAEKQVARWLTVILSGKRRLTLQLPYWHETARLRSSGCAAGREILYARWQSAVSDKLTCWRSTVGKASLKWRRWRDQVVGARASSSTQEHSPSVTQGNTKTARRRARA